MKMSKENKFKFKNSDKCCVNFFRHEIVFLGKCATKNMMKTNKNVIKKIKNAFLQ